MLPEFLATAAAETCDLSQTFRPRITLVKGAESYKMVDLLRTQLSVFACLTSYYLSPAET